MKTILIIEDDNLELKALTEKFSREELTVLSAKDGQEGLTTALQKHPDLILLDLIMPVMSGMDMLTKLRQDSWGNSVPVVILTNVDEQIMKIDAQIRGEHDYIIKTTKNLDNIVEIVKEKLGIK